MWWRLSRLQGLMQRERVATKHLRRDKAPLRIRAVGTRGRGHSQRAPRNGIATEPATGRTADSKVNCGGELGYGGGEDEVDLGLGGEGGVEGGGEGGLEAAFGGEVIGNEEE